MENGIKKAPKNAFPQKHRKYTCIVSCCRCGDTKSTLVILALSCSAKKTNYPKFPRVPSPESRVSLSPVGKKNRRLFILFRNLATPTLTTYLLHLAEFESLFFFFFCAVVLLWKTTNTLQHDKQIRARDVFGLGRECGPCLFKSCIETHQNEKAQTTIRIPH